MAGQPTGYTLIELIFIILVIGILAAISIPTWTTTPLGLEFEARRVLNDVRYAQMMSMATGQRYRWVRVSGNSYSVLNEAGSAVILPDGGAVTVLTSGVAFGSFSNLPNNLVAFDSLGTPYNDTSLPGTALSSTGSIALTSGGQIRSVYILSTTGYSGIS